MVTLKLSDKNFYGNLCSSKYGQPKNIKWYRGPEQLPVQVYTDACLPLAFNKKNHIKIAWLLEPKSISPYTYQVTERYIDEYDHIFAHDLCFASKYDKVSYIPFGGTWIKDIPVSPNKDSNLSIIASKKTITEGHQLRHHIIHKCHAKGVNVDVYGYGYRPIEFKNEGLEKYRFSIVVENDRIDGYFTEKLIDCLLCKTIPVYWGDPKIGSIFDSKGIIPFDTIDNIDFDTLSEDLYQEKLGAVEKNYELAYNYLCAEDHMYRRLVDLEVV